MREDKLYARLRPYLKKWGNIERIENSVSSGIWDIHYCIDGQLGWIETKIEKGGLLYFEKFQPSFGRRMQRAGCENLYVMTSGPNYDEIRVYLAHVVLSAPMTKKGKWTVVKTEDIPAFLILKKPYDWEMLRSLLTE